MTLNPVERCLLDVRGHWEEFLTEVPKRLLVWHAPDNALRVLQCFFSVQAHETAYGTDDLFLTLDAPYEHSIQYSKALKEALAGHYEASREDLQEQGIRPDWQFDPLAIADSATGVVESCRSFVSRHHEISGLFVAVLMPAAVADDNAFAGWLTRALGARVPERVRLVVVDSIETPRLKRLVESKHPLVRADAPRIDAAGLAQETFAQEGAVGPAAVFRNHLMGLVALVEKGSPEQVKRKAADALAFARKAQWPDQEVVVGMLVAGSLLKEKRFGEAIEGYRNARLSAEQAVVSGHPAGGPLVLQTHFGEAGVHLAGGNAAHAAKCYEQAALLAQRIPDLSLAIEATRMGAFCQSRMGNRQAAAELGSKAMALGEHLQPNARSMTTLPLVAVDLLRAVAPDRVTFMEGIARRREARLEKARRVVEEDAVRLEGTSDPRPFRAAEERYASERAAAEQAAARDMNALGREGRGPFTDAFSRARKLLGPGWPLASGGALPRLTLPGGGRAR